MVLGLFGVCWVMPKIVVELLACWLGCFQRHWNVLCGWLPRLFDVEGEEQLEFLKTEKTMPYLKSFFFRTSLDWMSFLLSVLMVCS